MWSGRRLGLTCGETLFPCLFWTGLLFRANASGCFCDSGKVVCESSAKILVVEDHPNTLTVLGMVLEILGYHCILARDAGSALARAAHEPFDAIITDVKLSGRDG